MPSITVRVEVCFDKKGTLKELKASVVGEDTQEVISEYRKLTKGLHDYEQDRTGEKDK